MLLFEKNMVKKVKNLILILTAAGIIFAGGYYLGVDHQKVYQPDQKLDLSLFWEAYNRIENQYIDSKHLDEKKLVHGAIRGMVNSLDDPHTKFFNPEESKRFLEEVSGHYEGVGMEVGLREDKIKIISPIENTPADRVGVRPGDEIIKINNKSTSGMSLEEAVDIMRGKEGTDVNITIIRNEEKKQLTLTRDRIKIPSIDFKVLEDDIAYLKIHYFHQNLLNEFNKIVPKITSSNTNKMIIDLRNNPGGALNSALEVAEYFVDKGDVIVKSQGINGKIEEVYKAESSSVKLNHELVILINKGSASASEILAAALRYHNNAKIVGETSYGKGSIQTMVNLSDMSNLKITISHWVTPGGKLIKGKGIKPDYQVSLDKADFESKKDPQLDKAIEILK